MVFFNSYAINIIYDKCLYQTVYSFHIKCSYCYEHFRLDTT